MSARVPLFSLSRHSPHHTDPQALEAFYADRRLMWWNVIYIGIANLGWALVFGIVGNLMRKKLLDLGVMENIQGTMNGINNLAVMFLVMLFSWMSDHTVSRVGRRKPYFFISAPFIIATVVLFPFFSVAKFVWLLLVMQVISMLFMDLKMSTFSLIMIDCVPRKLLGRTNSIFGIVSGVAGFIAMFEAGWLISLGEWVPYVLGGAVMILTTLCACLIREPPVYHPPKEPFKPWSTFKVAALDKRVFVLMAGVALVGAYGYSNVLWQLFWCTEKLKLTLGDIFKVLAWTQLANMALAYPIGWVIDRFGGLKVVVAFFVLNTVCFFCQLHIHDKSGLLLFVLAQTVIGPLYSAADIMVYKSAPEQDVGSITSTNAFFRNAFGGIFSIVSGLVISWAAHNYLVGFILGQIISTIGMVLFFIHAWLIRTGPPPPAQTAVDNGTSSESAAGKKMVEPTAKSDPLCPPAPA
ncbi:MAG TPA: MFS transporter [Candidatus Limnocylindrales bacterium]|nr:MFS transporter [Candidatus Limnocylindrales bacterium]